MQELLMFSEIRTPLTSAPKRSNGNATATAIPASASASASASLATSTLMPAARPGGAASPVAVLRLTPAGNDPQVQVEPAVATFPTPSPQARTGRPISRSADRRFALHDIADDHGRVQGRDLLFRLDSMHQPSTDGQALDHVSGSLANALLDAYAANSLPVGRLFVPMGETALRSSVAEAVTAGIGAILLKPDLPINTNVLMRVAQLRASGVRFSIDGITSEHDPRWLLAPYAESVRLNLEGTPPERLNALVARADADGLEVIGSGVQSMMGYQRLELLAVTQLQGPFISPPMDLVVPALPGCDRLALQRARSLVASRVSMEAVAVPLASDPALVMRLQLLHRLYGVVRCPEPGSLAALLQSLPSGVLAAWLEILSRTACHDHHVHWAHSVRDQVETYRRSLRSRCHSDDAEALQDSVWVFLKRLSSPTHYLKTLRYPA
jgi:hypothetical protein